MYSSEYLEDVRKVGVTLHAKCNAGEVFSNEQGVLLDMFNMWLVKNGIANLLSVNCLERDGFRVTSDSLGDWLVTSPDSGVLKFKSDTGVCEGFPYCTGLNSCHRGSSISNFRL